MSDLDGGNVSNLTTRILSSISSRMILTIIELLSFRFSINISFVKTKSVSNNIKLAVHDVIWLVGSITWKQPSGKNNYSKAKTEI